jgi:hypothetical protein
MSEAHRPRSERFLSYFFCWPKVARSRGVPLLFRRRPFDVAPWLIVVLTAVAGYYLEKFEFVHLLEMQGLDVQLAIQGTEPSQDIYIVNITDEDYSNMFGAKSPLNACTVKNLVSAVMDLNPKVIGVDLYTTDTAWQTVCNPDQCKPGTQLPEADHKASKDSSAPDLTCLEPKNGPTVIWAAIPESKTSQEMYTWENTENERLVVLPPLGGHWPDWEFFSGIPGFPQDSDGKVRKYVGQFSVYGKTAAPLVIDSFSAAIAKEYGARARGGRKPRIFDFGSPTKFPSMSAQDLIDCQTPPCVFKTDGVAAPSPRGRIVLIGGQFRAARDAYESPSGPMSGVRLNAMAIESDLRGGGIKEPESWVRFLGDFVLGLGLTFSYWYFKLTRHAVLAILVATLGMAVIALLLSYVFFQVFAFCLPVLIGINMHQYLEHVFLAAKE